MSMNRFRFKKIDAFSTGQSSGNPAGYILIDGQVPDTDMQQIARELKGFVSEVGFVRAGSGSEDFIIRYFSCEREVEFCGHATVAILDDLIKNTPTLQAKNIIMIRTNAGVLAVENRISTEGMIYIHSPLPEYKENVPDLEETAHALGLTPGDIDPAIPMGIVHVGQHILIIRLTTLEACIRCLPVYETLRAFALSQGIEVMHISARETQYLGHAYRVRVFAPAFGYLEDPATGSGNAAFGYHLIRSDLWDGRSLVLEQGPDLQYPNIVYIELSPDGSMLFGGNGIVRIDGYYCLH